MFGSEARRPVCCSIATHTPSSIEFRALRSQRSISTTCESWISCRSSSIRPESSVNSSGRYPAALEFGGCLPQLLGAASQDRQDRISIRVRYPKNQSRPSNSLLLVPSACNHQQYSSPEVADLGFGFWQRKAGENRHEKAKASAQGDGQRRRTARSGPPKVRDAHPANQTVYRFEPTFGLDHRQPSLTSHC